VYDEICAPLFTFKFGTENSDHVSESLKSLKNDSRLLATTHVDSLDVTEYQ
jgi:hypothetical protein